jgi:hypothetical protein
MTFQYDVFVSYAREDEPVAKKLSEGLTSLGVAVWRDRSHLGVGDAWRDHIREAVATSKFLSLS